MEWSSSLFKTDECPFVTSECVNIYQILVNRTNWKTDSVASFVSFVVWSGKVRLQTAKNVKSNQILLKNFLVEHVLILNKKPHLCLFIELKGIEVNFITKTYYRKNVDIFMVSSLNVLENFGFFTLFHQSWVVKCTRKSYMNSI